jgi:hypothetical protein
MWAAVAVIRQCRLYWYGFTAGWFASLEPYLEYYQQSVNDQSEARFASVVFDGQKGLLAKGAFFLYHS